MQVILGDDDLVAIAAEMLGELLPGRHTMRQPLLASFRRLFLRSARRQRPGEPRQHDQTTGEATPPARPLFNGAGVVCKGLSLVLSRG